MEIDPVNIIIDLQKRIRTKYYKKGTRINYIICIIFLILLHIGGLYDIFVTRLPPEIHIPINSISLEKIVYTYIPIYVHPYMVIWILATILFSINTLEETKEIGVKDPKCYSCNSPMNTHLKCSNPKCKKEFH